jgi:importin-5
VRSTTAEEDEENVEEREGWETLQLDGQTVGIRTSAIEEKCQVFVRFYFHDGVREACAVCFPPFFYFISNHIG